jgi:hypothetical protein
MSGAQFVASVAGKGVGGVDRDNPPAGWRRHQGGDRGEHREDLQAMQNLSVVAQFRSHRRIRRGELSSISGRERNHGRSSNTEVFSSMARLRDDRCRIGTPAGRPRRKILAATWAISEAGGRTGMKPGDTGSSCDIRLSGITPMAAIFRHAGRIRRRSTALLVYFFRMSDFLDQSCL